MWPVGFAIGVVCVLVGLVVSWPAVAVGGAIAIVFGALWVRDLLRPRAAAPAAPAAPEAPAASGPKTFPRSKFLEGATLGLGAVIGGAVTAPTVAFAVVPTFLKQGRKEIDLGPLEDFPESKWVLARFMLKPDEGDVSERTIFVRYNGLLGDQPSFTIISNRCAHLGCPVQQYGPLEKKTKQIASEGQRVMLQQAIAITGFGCPCHGGAYDSEGNRTAGPPVRALDRYQFSIRKGRLFLGKAYSVGSVKGTGANAKIEKFRLTQPGDHVGDWESWLWPYNPQP